MPGWLHAQPSAHGKYAANGKMQRSGQWTRTRAHVLKTRSRASKRPAPPEGSSPAIKACRSHAADSRKRAAGGAPLDRPCFSR
jgi:hypothetical protein